MGINKVQYGNTTLIDLTSDTVTADKLMQGYTAHDRTGALITGTATGGGSGGNVWQDQDGFLVIPPDGSGGGGGSSDFSTAKMTFIVQNSASATITNLLLVWGQVGERYWVYREEIPFTDGTATLPLVDGYTSFGIVPDSGVVVTVSGNAEYYSEDEEIGVTGDCTITIS